MKDALFGRPRRRKWRRAAAVLLGALALWFAVPAVVRGADAALRDRYARDMTALETENRALRSRLAACADAAEENAVLRQTLESRPAGWRLTPARTVSLLPDGFLLAGSAPAGTAVLDRNGRWAGQVTVSGHGLCTVQRGTPAGLAGTAVGLVKGRYLTGLPVPVTLEQGALVTTPEGLWLGTLAQAPVARGLTASARLTDTADMGDWLYFLAEPSLP